MINDGRVFIGVAFLLGAVLVGCSSTSVLLKPSLVSYEKVIPANQEVLPNITLTEVRDNRENSQLGEARTGVQYVLTPVLASSTPENLVGEMLKLSFAQQNIYFDEVSPYMLEVVIEKLWLTEVLTNNEAAKCELELRSVLRHREDPKRTWSNTTRILYQSHGDLQDGTEKIAPTFATCINMAVDKIIRDTDFVAFLKK